MSLALRTTSPNYRHTLEEKYAARLAEDPLLLSHGKNMPRQDPNSRSSYLPRPAASTPERTRPPPPKSPSADVSLTDAPRQSVPPQPPAAARAAGGRLGQTPAPRHEPR
jgi:hypothetical protein